MELTDEQLLSHIDSVLPITIYEGDLWYGGSTTILSRDENGNYLVNWECNERIGWEDEYWYYDESEDNVDSQTLINYLRNRKFGSAESEETFKESLKAELTRALDMGELLSKEQ